MVISVPQGLLHAGRYALPVLALTFALLPSAGGVARAGEQDGGRVVAWGRNDLGQTSVPAGLDHVVAVAAGVAHALALRSDGTVTAWGAGGYSPDSDPTAVPEGLRDVVGIAAGAGFSAALRRDGSVEVWPKGRLCHATPPPGLGRIVSLAAGSDHLVGLREDGTVAAWGHTEDNETTVPAGLVGVRQVAVAGTRSWALRHDGSIVGWGAGYDHGYPMYPDVREAIYRCDAPPNAHLVVADTLTNIYSDNARESGVTSIAAGPFSLVRRHGDGTLSVSGDEGCPLTLPPGLTDVAAVAVSQASSRPHALALKSDGTVAAWGCRGKFRPVPEGLRDVTAIAAGGDFDLALTSG